MAVMVGCSRAQGRSPLGNRLPSQCWDSDVTGEVAEVPQAGQLSGRRTRAGEGARRESKSLEPTWFGAQCLHGQGAAVKAARGRWAVGRGMEAVGACSSPTRGRGCMVTCVTGRRQGGAQTGNFRFSRGESSPTPLPTILARIFPNGIYSPLSPSSCLLWKVIVYNLILYPATFHSGV